MPTTRKCAQCGEPTLQPIKRSMEIYNSLYHYKCSNCDHKVELVPTGSLGMQIMITLLIAPVIWVLFFDDHGALPGWNNLPTVTEAIVFITIISILPIMTLTQILKHRRYPAIKADHKTKHKAEHWEIEPSSNLTRKPVTWIENMGFFGGFLSPLLFIIIFLGLAALIGYINFTFFDDKLFGFLPTVTRLA